MSELFSFLVLRNIWDFDMIFNLIFMSIGKLIVNIIVSNNPFRNKIDSTVLWKTLF